MSLLSGKDSISSIIPSSLTYPANSAISGLITDAFGYKGWPCVISIWTVRLLSTRSDIFLIAKGRIQMLSNVFA